MIERTQVGTHAIWTEDEEGLICLLQSGLAVEAHAVKLTEVLAAHAVTMVPGEPYFILADWREATGVTKDARKAIATAEIRREDIYLAAFGASFAFRVVANLVFSAINLLSSSRVVVTFKATESESREWLREQRRAYFARKREGAAPVASAMEP
ncbi:MAG TPA: hypothetical protein VM580_30595 [Labilithrix sp.]|jgi:hypothetical protein|nr:hypothetical protein [Labilithrix sp.]